MEPTPELNSHNKEEYPPMHTTEHIVNRTMMNMFGCGRAIGAHIERKKSKLDYKMAKSPTEQEINTIEATVNDVIGRGLDVTTEFITQAEAQSRFDLTRLPDDASETVRVVRVGDYDECLCIGKHVDNTAQIGTFKIVSSDWNAEKNIWRLRFKLTD